MECPIRRGDGESVKPRPNPASADVVFARFVAIYRDPPSVQRRKITLHRKKIFVHHLESFRAGRTYDARHPRFRSDQVMKNVVPVFFALLPLMAVVGACVIAP
jgi:hypothetical protein